MTQRFKKLSLSAAVIFSFVFYALYLRGGGGRNITVASVSVQADPAQVSVSPGKTPAQTVPRQTAPSTPPSTAASNYYSDGQFVGSTANAYYGNVQVEATIRNGKIVSVQFLKHPTERMTSEYINSQAMPILTSEAVQDQSSNVDIVSGATYTSHAFMQSLSSALNQSHQSTI